MRPQTRPFTVLCLVIATAARLSAQPVDEVSRKNALVHSRLGEELMRAEQFEKASNEFSSAVKLDPLLTIAHYELGQAHMSLKRYVEAVHAYVGCREAFRQIAGLIVSNDVVMDNRREEEIRELRDSIRRFQSGQIKTAYRDPSLMVAKLEQRIADLERTKQRGTIGFETPAEVSLALGSALFRNGQREEAEIEWKAAAEVNPKLGEAHNNLAVIYMQTGRLDEADAELKLAEKNGFRVNPQFKDDLKSRRKNRRHHWSLAGTCRARVGRANGPPEGGHYFLVVVSGFSRTGSGRRFQCRAAVLGAPNVRRASARTASACCRLPNVVNNRAASA